MTHMTFQVSVNNISCNKTINRKHDESYYDVGDGFAKSVSGAEIILKGESNQNTHLFRKSAPVKLLKLQ